MAFALYEKEVREGLFVGLLACPTWAATGIAGEGGRSFLETFAFPVSPYGPGVTSSINAILRTDEELKEGDALDDGKCFIEVLAPFRKLDFLKNSKFGWSYTVVEIFCDNSTGRSTIYS